MAGVSLQAKEIRAAGYLQAIPWCGLRALWGQYVGDAGVTLDMRRRYWMARDQTGRRVFIKVYCGYPVKPMERYLGRKEVYLGEMLSSIASARADDCAVADPVDHWYGAGGYYVVSRWRAVRDARGDYRDLKTQVQRLDILAAVLSGLPRPIWYDEQLEERVYVDRSDLDWEEDEAFDADGVQNMAVTEDGRLFVHDFEKIQWGPRGLQGLYGRLELAFGAWSGGWLGDAPWLEADIATFLTGETQRTLLRVALASLSENLEARGIAPQRIQQFAARWGGWNGGMRPPQVE